MCCRGEWRGGTGTSCHRRPPCRRGRCLLRRGGAQHAEVFTIVAHRAELQRVRRGVAGFAAVFPARAVHLDGARLRQGRAAGARPRKVPSCSSCGRLGPSPSSRLSRFGDRPAVLAGRARCCRAGPDRRRAVPDRDGPVPGWHDRRGSRRERCLQWRREAAPWLRAAGAGPRREAERADLGYGLCSDLRRTAGPVVPVRPGRRAAGRGVPGLRRPG